MTLRAKRLTQLLSAHPLFCGLDGQTVQEIIGEASEIVLEKDEILYTSGEPATEVYVILSGVLEIEYPAQGETRGLVVAMLPTPGFLGEAQVINNQNWSGTGVAISDLVALGIRKKQFVSLTTDYNELTRRLYFELTRRFLGAIEQWRRLPTSRPEMSIARYLLARCELLADLQADDTTVPMRQADLGRASGVRRETANRLLSKWAKAGWIEIKPTGIRVIEQEPLEALLREANAAPLILRTVVPTVD